MTETYRGIGAEFGGVDAHDYEARKRAIGSLLGVLDRYRTTGYSADWYQYQHLLTQASKGRCSGCCHCCDTCNRDGHYCDVCNDVVEHDHDYEHSR